MKIRFLFVVITSILSFTSCKSGAASNIAKDIDHTFGVFLGVSNNNIDKLKQYDNVAIEIEEFSKDKIDELKNNNTKIYSYLSIGSLEKYRSYYDDYKDLTFMDYDNWPDERWIDISNPSWKSHLINTASTFKELGSDGIFMDNFDVYYIVKEEYECSNEFQEDIYQGCKDILKELDKLGMSLLINSGTELLERLKDEHQDEYLNMIDWCAQETVFSSIKDYENDIFDKQNEEDKEYYLEMINMMKPYSHVLLIEYTKDIELINEIKEYCHKENIYYYISSSISLI